MNKTLLTLLLGTTALVSSVSEKALATSIQHRDAGHFDGSPMGFMTMNSKSCVAFDAELIQRQVAEIVKAFESQNLINQALESEKKALDIFAARNEQIKNDELLARHLQSQYDAEFAQDLSLQEENLAPETNKETGLKVRTKDWGEKFKGVSDLFKQASDNRSELHELRERHMKKFAELQEDESSNYTALAKDVTSDTIAYVQKRVARLIEKMGPAPCEFSLFSLGSMPRSESGFYTDLEIGILMKHNTVKTRKYFTQLTQRLSDELFLLGEHPDVGGKGLRIDEADNAPMHMRWFARYASPQQARNLLSSALANRTYGERMQLPYEGSRIFLTTPEQMALYSDVNHDWGVEGKTQRETRNNIRKNRQMEQKRFKTELSKALRDPANKGRPRHEISEEVRHYVRDIVRLFNARELSGIKNTRELVRNITSIYGSDRIFNEYMKRRETILSRPVEAPHPLYTSVREHLAVNNFMGDITNALLNSKNPIVSGVIDSEIDLKREFYRFPEQMLTNLGFYFNLGEQNTYKIAGILGERGFFNEEVTEILQSWMNYATSLRLKQQAHARKQGFKIPTSQEEYDDGTEKLLKEVELQERVIRLYKISGLNPEQLKKEELKLTELRSALKTHKKHAPLNEDSILSKAELAKLERFLPKCQGIFTRCLAFIQGDKEAFSKA